MIRLRLAAGDFTQMRFGFSPMTELVFSLYMLHSGQVDPLYRGWTRSARQRVRDLDAELLQAVVPHRGVLPDFPQGSAGFATTIEQQLKLLAGWEADLLRAELEAAWRFDELPSAAQRLLAAGPAGLRRLADVFWAYWEAVLAPHWRRMWAVLESEVAYRARQLARGGLTELLTDLHPWLQLDHDCLSLNQHSDHDREYDLTGTGLLLMPCIFATPNVMFGPVPNITAPCLIYRPRGVATVWETIGPGSAGDDPLGALIGRSRAAILRSTSLPKSTTELAREFGRAGGTVSEHLSTLRRCGMITSWRSGRSVLYQRTPLATSLMITADGGDGPA